MPDDIFEGTASLPFQYGGFVNKANSCYEAIRFSRSLCRCAILSVAETVLTCLFIVINWIMHVNGVHVSILRKPQLQVYID